MPRQLNLERPVVFFDLETTGVNPTKDKIVEISMLKVHPDGSEETFHSLVNPMCPIPESSTAIHGISNEDVANAPTFAEIALKIAGFIENSDLGGYNCLRFDVPLLAESFLEVDVPIDLRSRRIVDVQVIFHKKEQRTLSAAYAFYCDKVLEDAHTATADTRATYEVLLGQLERYDDLPTSIDGLDEYTHFIKSVDFAGRFVYDEDENVIFNFGKYKGKSVEDVLSRDPNYYHWMMDSDFPRDTKYQLQKIKIRLEGNAIKG